MTNDKTMTKHETRNASSSSFRHSIIRHSFELGHSDFVILIIGAAFLLSTTTFSAPLIPTKEGTTWSYNMTQELGKGIKLSDVEPDTDGKVRAPVVYHIAGMQNVEGKQLLLFEMHRAGTVTNTDLITVDKHGIVCWGRINLDGEVIELDPPQTMIGALLEPGAKWDFDGQTGTLKVHQHYRVNGEEDVDVPAGTFRAFHIHGEQKSPSPTTIDRWFVPGTGIVKDVTTMRSDRGDLVQRISLELKEAPKIAPRPAVEPTPSKLSADLAARPMGESVTIIAFDTPKIYARWRGHRLREQAKVRVIWIAEHVDEVPPNYKVDEAYAFSTAPNSHGIFTLAQPDGGWAPGDYRAEFYVDEGLQQTVKLKITK